MTMMIVPIITMTIFRLFLRPLRRHIYEWVLALSGTIVAESAPLFVDQLRHRVTKCTPLYEPTEISYRKYILNFGQIHSAIWKNTIR